MSEIISISTLGSIRVLDIPLEATIEDVKAKLTSFVYEENSNCIYVKDVLIDNLPSLNITYSKGENNAIKEIVIRQYHISEKESTNVYSYFQKEFQTLNILKKTKDDSSETIMLSNILHKVIISKFKGIGGSNEDTYPIRVGIYGKFLEGDKAQLQESARQLYADISYKTIAVPPTLKSYKNKMNTIKLVFIILALIIAYLYVLNGRYIKVGSEYYFDKWTKTMIYVERNRVIE